MKNKLVKLGIVLSIAWSWLIIKGGASLASAQEAWADNSLGLKCVDGPHNDVATIQGIMCAVANVGTAVFAVVGLGGLVMLTVSGLRYMLSGGNAQGIEKARKGITGVIIGFILLLASILILNLIKALTGVDVTKIVFPE